MQELLDLKRGVLEIISEEELKQKLIKSKQEGKPLRIKLGLDPTAPHVHLGFAVVLRKLRQFQDLGHEVYLIIGDFTARIGDPSGKSIMRPMLSEEEIKLNAQTYQEQFSKILDPLKTKVVFNSQWLSQLNLIDLINLTSKYTVAQILERDDFKKRYTSGQAIGMHEFLYPLLQGYDSVYLSSDVELGGMDQKFNILVGRELQRAYKQVPQAAIFMPILEGLDGVQKMSKSLGNYIGITESPKEIFGKIMSLPDEIMFKYFELCTNINLTEVEKMKKGFEEKILHPKEIKKRLAKEIITIYYNQDLAYDAEEEFERVFVKKEIPSNIPEISLAPSDIKNGKIWIVNLLILADLAESKRDARRLIAQGAVELNGEKINSPDLDLEVKDEMVLKVGSRNFAKIRVI
ncbi:MAG: tyrosine--tRNA ligase [Armatimonadetes bacterium]|nr:tyrosine--tRNA ligase [Armatimonadota bacterium]